jgi:cytosol alanyl aminopeptidase
VKTRFLALAVLFLCAVRDVRATDPNRLDPNIAPISESLDLQLDPALEKFTGTARVELQFAVATNSFRFHAKEIDFEHATLDGKKLKLTPGEPTVVTVQSDDIIPPGFHVLDVTFTAKINTDGAGLYRADSRGTPYLFTQMEPQDARRVFPCWDEPNFKIPWQLTLTIPSDLVAVANMPVAQTTSLEKTRRIEFGRTPPLPSYLVAFAVGKFDFINIVGQAAPGRVYTVAGQKHLAALAARESPALLGQLEKYFGLPYPYPKLDHIAAPAFTFGAMENAGLITYRDTFLLFDEGSINYEQKRLLLEVIAHEMAHMWFGDLVTMQWWDDLWLNESFATWISYKIAGRVYPTLRFELKSYENIAAARAADTQPSVKPIRRPFKAGDNLMEAFDELSYNKGQAILRMVEGWLGEESFRKALRLYFEKHRWGNATAEDLWAAFGASGETSLQETLRRFIEQPGIPEVTFKRVAGDQLEVSQKRYRTIIGKGVPEQSWHIPITLRYGGAAGEQHSRVLLTNSSATFHIAGLDKAQWLYPNAGEAGYFTWNLPSDLTQALKNREAIPLTTTERLGVLNTMNLAVQSGSTPAEQAIALALGFAADSEPEVQLQVVTTLGSLHETYFTTPEQRRGYAQALRKALRPMLDRLGFEPKTNEEPQWDPLRAALLLMLAVRGEDSDALQFCRKAAAKQISEPRSVKGQVADLTLMVTSWYGDADWAKRVRESFLKAAEPDLRARFLAATIPFRDEKLAREGLDFLLTDNVRPTEVVSALGPAATQPELCGVVFDWIHDRYDALKKKLPEDLMPFFPSLLAAADEPLLARGRAFFLDPSRFSPFAEVEYKKAAEKVQLRTALRKLNGESVQKFFARGTSRTELQ